MKLQRLGRNLSVFLLLGVFIYSTSVKEFHYAFTSAAKYHSLAHADNCDHHIHSTNKEDDCAICKMDVGTLYYTVAASYSFTTVFISRSIVSAPDKVYFESEAHHQYLRGPPSLV